MPRTKSYGNTNLIETVRTTTLGFASLISALAIVFIPALPAMAHQSPSGCNSNRLNTSIIKDKTAIYNGDTLTYTITVSNANFNADVACDITNATVEVQLPASDGTPTGPVVTLASGVDYPAGTGVTVVGTVPYVVNVDPGVMDVVAKVSASGTLHDAPIDHAALIVKTLGTTVLTATPPAGGSGSGSGTTTGTSSITPKLPNTGTRKD